MQAITDLIRFVAIVEASVLGGLLIALLWRAVILGRHQRSAGVTFDAALSPLNLALVILSYCLYLFGSILRTMYEIGEPFSVSVFINPVGGFAGIIGMYA